MYNIGRIIKIILNIASIKSNTDAAHVSDCMDYTSAILKRVGDDEQWKSQIVHIKQFSDMDYIKSYHEAIVYPILSEIENIYSERNTANKSKIKILDFGCWSGITSYYIQKTTGCIVLGVDIDKNSIDFSKKYIQDDKTKFYTCDGRTIPIEDDTFDVACINQVFCNMRRSHFEPMISEISRVLKQGGRVVFVDSNNPKSIEVQDRLKTTYALLEGESGPYVMARQAIIDQLLPDTAPNKKLALDTCYMDKAQIEAEIQNFRKNGELLNPSYFDKDSLIPPVPMQSWGAPSSPTDPEFLISEFKKNGLSVKVGHYYPPNEKLSTHSSFYLIAEK